MNKRKEKRIKKLKRQRIWPHILGAIFLLIFTAVIIVAILGTYCANLFEKIVSMETDEMQQVVSLIDDKWSRGELTTEEMDEVCENIMKVNSNIEGICIMKDFYTSEGVVDFEVSYKYGDDVPGYNKESITYLYSTNNVEIMLTDDGDSVLTKDAVDLNKINWSTLFATQENLEDARPPLGYAKVWYIIPTQYTYDSVKVCIKTKLTVEAYEAEGVILALLGVSLLAGFIILYHICSIINLVFKKRRLAKIVYTDIITGGYNLQYFFDVGKKLLRKSIFKKNNAALVTLRMEKYRNFCSCYGTRTGEELLETYYSKIKKDLDKNELVVRAEKGDFAILLAYSSEEEILRRLSGIVKVLENVRPAQKIYFSVGIYRIKNKKEEVSEVYNLSGVAISGIPEDSEDRIRFFTDKMYEEQMWIRKVEDDMERALANNEFKVYLQPKYSPKEEKLSGAEALVRWIHPTEGFVPPFRFIPIFESNGFILKLDDYMIREVAKEQAKWLEEGKEIVPISVNVSRIHFTREDLAKHICGIVDEYNVPHDKIELELTESAFFDDKSILLNTVKELRNYGFAVSMDDFGAGYSSLNSLKELPLDVVKLDAEFFRDNDEDGRGDIIVGDTIALAKKLDMRIVAEGIETREQVDFLATKDCDLIQGYYFAKPMPLDEFEQLAFGEKHVEEKQ